MACWLRLFRDIEAAYKTDYIFVDLNPAACILNYLAMLRCSWCSTVTCQSQLREASNTALAA